MTAKGYTGKTAKMRFVSKIARATKIAALIHICVLLMGGTVAHAQQLPYGEWVETPNTAMSLVEVGGCHFAWAGAAYDDVNHEFWHLDVGGHGCAASTSKGDGYANDLDTALTGGQAWRMVEPPLPPSLTMWPGYTGSNCFLLQSDGTIHPPSTHTYGGPTWLGDGKMLFMGAFFRCVGTPDTVAALVDTTTTPMTWTPLPHLQIYAGTTAAALHGQHVYIVHSSGRWAKVDKDTLAIVANGLVGPVKHLNVNMPSSSAFKANASMGAGDVNADGFFCTRIDAAITCFNTNGSVVDSANNDSFGRGIRRSVPLECRVSGSSMTHVPPTGEFAMWGGSKRLCLFKPDPEPFLAASDGHVCSTAELQANCGYDGDTWRVIEPETGPNVDKVYSKIRWYEPWQALVGYGPSNLWAINPIDAPPPEAAESYSTPSFAARSAGALFANGFDTQPPRGLRGNQDAVTVNEGNQGWVLPHLVTSEDGQGALQFDMVPFSSSGAPGQYVFRLPEPCDLGDTCHFQWRMWFNDAFVDTQFKRYDNGGNTAPKLIIVSQSSSSNQPNEIVVTSTTGAIKAPTMYHNGNFFIQIPRVTTWPYVKGTWVTFNLTITKPTAGYQAGQFVYFDTHVLLQVKPDGGEIVTIVDSTEAMRSQNLIMDAAYITHYTTKKDYNQDHPHAFTRLDEVIYRKDAPIAFP
jgi:hypothetical protein